MSASFSTWLSVGVGSRGTRRVDSTRALPCQEVSDADCRGNWKRPRLQAGEDLVNRGEQLRINRATPPAPDVKRLGSHRYRPALADHRRVQSRSNPMAVEPAAVRNLAAWSTSV